MHIGFIYNIATEELLRERPEITLNECESDYAIEAVTRALESAGHRVTGLNADRNLPRALVDANFDIVFNIATGVYGETRQSHVPAMLEYLQIPHTGSGVLAEAICHHKPQTKMILMAHGIPTAPFQVFKSADDPLRASLRFPLIAKLPSEGGSLGLSNDSVVEDEQTLRKQVTRLIDAYGEGVIAEEYLSGREFTVSVLGNDPPYTLPIAELQYFGEQRIRLDEPDAPMFEDFKRAIGNLDLSYEKAEFVSVAPADLAPETAELVGAIALDAYRAIGCKDWARVDMRMNERGEVFVLEMNLEPGIAPDYVLPKSAYAAGWSYETLILRILDHAVERYPHLRNR